MREEGLQWAWEKGLISGIDAYSGQPIQLINRGTWNRFEPGPDFRNACIQIGDITWHGDIEIHIHASDWHKHKHHLDPNYSNVILHVVTENDHPLRMKGELIPTIIIPEHIIKHLNQWSKKATGKLPCEHTPHTFTPEFLHSHWRIRMIRKQQEYASEKEIAAYLLGYGIPFHPQKRNGRQRASGRMQTALVQVKNSQFIQNHSPLYIQLEGLEKAMKKNLTHFETQSILLNGIIPFFWSEPNETALSAFAKTLPAEKNRIITQFQAITAPPKNAYETQALLEINRQLCSHNQCLRCELGRKMLTR
jgi:Protein of unknown function (DUF2851)